jgi:hypothetical protein
MPSTPQRSAGDVSHPPEVLELTACTLYHTAVKNMNHPRSSSPLSALICDEEAMSVEAGSE